MRIKLTALSFLAALFFVPVAATAQTSAPPPWPPPEPASAPTAAPASTPAPRSPAAVSGTVSPGSPAAVPAPSSNTGYTNSAPNAPAPTPATATPVSATPPPAPFPSAMAPAIAEPKAGGEPLVDGAPAAAEGVTETDLRPRGFIPQLSLGDSVGLLHMESADVGIVGQLRLSLHGEYFTGSNFLVESDTGARGDRDTRLQGAFTFGVTPIEHLELFGAVLGSGNRNRRLCSSDSDCISELGRTDPEVIKSFGDLVLGGKVAYPVAPGLSLGGELGLRFMSSISGLSFSPDSTSVWVNGIASYDLKPVLKTVPLRLHLNVGYYVDNSGNLVDYTGNNTTAFSRYVSRFAYGISEDRFRLALGADAPFDEVAPGFSLRPLVEYHLEVLTGSQDPVIRQQEHATCGQPGASACKDNRDLHWITLGIQGQVLHGLTMTLGLDVGLRSPGFAYGPAVPPWNLLFGVGYPLDLVPRIVRNVPVVKVVTREAPPREGLVAGRVISAQGTAIEGAVIGVKDHEHARVLTDADGTFQSVPLAPGPVELLVVAKGFEKATLKTEVIAGQTANVLFRLTPKAPASRVIGRVSDDSGKGIVASIKLAGPQIAEGKSDTSGNFAVPVTPGVYVVRVDADQYLSKEMQVTVSDGRDTAVSITLRSRPAISAVTFQNGKFKLRQPVKFKSVGRKPTAELADGMPHLLDEVVDILVNHPEIRLVRVEAHWDSSLSRRKAETLTTAQAKAVAGYLVDQGIAQDRVIPEGMGSKKPIVPNIGRGKLKNRRVEFVVGSN